MSEHCDRTMSGQHVHDLREAETRRPFRACLCGERPTREEIAGNEVMREIQREIYPSGSAELPGEADIESAIWQLENAMDDARDLVEKLEAVAGG